MRSMLLILSIFHAYLLLACPVDLVSQSGENPFDLFSAHLLKQFSDSKQAEERKKQLRRLAVPGSDSIVLDTSSWFPELLMEQIWLRLPTSTIIIQAAAGDKIFRAGQVLTEDGKMDLVPSEVHPFKQISEQLRTSLEEVLETEGRLETVSAELRVTDKKGPQNVLPHWHIDGEYLTVAVSLLGPGTEYLVNISDAVDYEALEKLDVRLHQVKKARRGQALVMTGVERWYQQRVKPTIHRSPVVRSNRIFFISRYQLKKRKK